MLLSVSLCLFLFVRAALCLSASASPFLHFSGYCALSRSTLRSSTAHTHSHTHAHTLTHTTHTHSGDHPLPEGTSGCVTREFGYAQQREGGAGPFLCVHVCVCLWGGCVVPSIVPYFLSVCAYTPCLSACVCGLSGVSSFLSHGVAPHSSLRPSVSFAQVCKFQIFRRKSSMLRP